MTQTHSARAASPGQRRDTLCQFAKSQLAATRSKDNVPATKTDAEAFVAIVAHGVQLVSGLTNPAESLVGDLQAILIGQDMREGRSHGPHFIGHFRGASGFRPEFRDAGNQVQHAMAGIVIAYRYGTLGELYALWAEDEPQDLALYRATFPLGRTLTNKNYTSLPDRLWQTIKDSYKAETIVVIDPGHGGATNTGGSDANHAVTPNGLLEKELTLDVGLRCRTILTQKGHTVFMTRGDDSNLGLADRAHVARDRQAAAFVSIHFNGDANATVQGTETFVYTGTAQTAPSSKLARRVQSQVLGVTSYRDRGVKELSLGVLNPKHHFFLTAACLVEISFITDSHDAARLTDESYKNRLGEAVALAIIDYIKQDAG